MKTITIIGARKVEERKSLLNLDHKHVVDTENMPSHSHATPELKDVIIEGDESVSVSDGYHTMDELYEHRIALHMALCRNIYEVLSLENPGKYKVWRSKKHSDGELAFGGTWFVLGIGTKAGEQITYHLPIEKWEDCEFAEELERAPEFDGHTSSDVLERLKTL